MDINSNDSYEEEFDSNDISGRQTIFPSRTQILISLLITSILIILIEKISVNIFLYLIPNYLILAICWIIIHLVILRYLIFIFIFPGKSSLVNFYLRVIFGRIRAKSFNSSLEHFQTRIDKVIKCSKNAGANMGSQFSVSQIKSKVSSRYVEIYEKIKAKYGNLNEFENEFLEKLNEFKGSIENSSLQEIFMKYINKEQIVLTEKDLTEFETIKREAKQIQNLLNLYRGEYDFSVTNFFKYLKNFFYNDILSSKKFVRVNAILTKPNSEEIKIKTKDDCNLDCLLIYSNINGEKKCSDNLVIVCGPNLTPFENLISSWDIDNLYLSNEIDIFFWNYRGYGFSEGDCDLSNICEDILSIYDYINSNYQYKKIIVHGLSIGGVPACHLALKKNVHLIIADRTFGSVQDVINTFPLGTNVVYYLAKIICFPFVNNTSNFINSKCKKILMNDPEDKTIIDTFSLKTSMSKRIIKELFHMKNPDLNIRKLSSNNILDYALEPEQAKEIFNAFKYTINFLRNKDSNLNEANNGEELLILERTNIFANFSEKKPKLVELMNENNTETKKEKLSMKEVSDIFYTKIKKLYSNFNSAGDYLVRFVDYMNTPTHFNNFFNNLFVFGSEDSTLVDYSLCNIHSIDEMLNNFIQESDNFLNSEPIRNYSDYNIYKNFSFFVDCIKSLKIYMLSIHLENIEKEWFFELKGKLIPLNCGHILFYDEKELDTFKFLLNEAMSGYEVNIPEEQK